MLRADVMDAMKGLYTLLPMVKLPVDRAKRFRPVLPILLNLPISANSPSLMEER